MPTTASDKTRFSIKSRVKSFTHAFRGFCVFIKTTHNAWLQVVALVVVVILGFVFGITETEWLALIVSSGLVLSAEAFNTAIEIDIDLTSPEFHSYARDTKDVAAGAVLITSVMAAIVGLVIFLPHVIALFR